MEMLFSQAFNEYILHQKITGWGFQLNKTVTLRNGFNKDIGGYYTEYENGYRMMISGESLGETPVQEALIIDPEGIPVAKDTEDCRWPLEQS